MILFLIKLTRAQKAKNKIAFLRNSVYTIQLTNSLTHKKEILTVRDRSISLYVCGITPYDYAHLGHGRCYITFDILYRFLQANKLKVTYCRNITDIDDKLIARAVREHNDQSRYIDVAQRFIDAFHEDLARLNCQSPTYEPRVTQEIPEIIAFIQELVDAGYAYVVNGDVYYRVNAFAEYGKLSKRQTEELWAGHRVAIDERKENPVDFALWKSEPGKDFFESPWGHGRPGWHIECSEMVKRYCGETVDIHGGGLDLLFPHHENEVAQSEALHGVPLARIWMHNAFVRIDNEKMSKSLGNFFTLRDIFDQYDPMVVRYFLVAHHYRSPLDFSLDMLGEAEKAYKRLCRLFIDTDTLETIPESPLVNRIWEFLCDDLNLPGALGAIFENREHLMQDASDRAAVKTIIQDVLGLSLEALPEKVQEISSEVQTLLVEREEARRNKQWEKADEIRDRLKQMGYDVKDEKITK